MRSANYYKRRAIMLAVFWLSLLAGLYLIATHLNWVGDGYCWGSIDKCYPATIGGK
jgi:hypothetical protein